MEFKDRKATNPGRVTLKNVSTGATTTYDIAMADNPTEQGTTIRIFLHLNTDTQKIVAPLSPICKFEIQRCT